MIATRRGTVRIGGTGSPCWTNTNLRRTPGEIIVLVAEDVVVPPDVGLLLAVRDDIGTYFRRHSIGTHDSSAETRRRGERYCRGRYRLGRMIALQKPDGGVRGIVVGDIIRRLVARTVATQVSKQAEVAIAPFQYALSPPRQDASALLTFCSA